MAASPQPTVDVVVCTRNRSHLLAPACEALLDQDYPPDLWRLILIDSASTDDTPAVGRALAERFPGRVLVHREDEPGHSAARNAGIARSTADVVAFTDDDALADRAWLRTLVATLDREKADAAGGPVDALIHGELPPWFLPFYLLFLAIWRPAEETRRLTYSEYPRGVNLAFRREVFARCGLFDRRLGLRGDRQLYGEEIELCLRIERAGGLVCYSPASVVRHRVDAARLTETWLRRRFAAQGRSEAIVNCRHAGWRGVLRGARAYLRRRTPIAPQAISAWGGGPVDPTATIEAARIFTGCLRAALAGYMRQAPLAMLTVPRYRPPRGRPIQAWTPP